ncbi:MAG: hypothetical protein WC879_09010 [Melioribacteraceae bacterium]
MKIRSGILLSIVIVFLALCSKLSATIMITGDEFKKSYQQSEREAIYNEVNQFIKEGKFKEASEKFRTIKQMNWEDFYCWSVLLTLNHQYDDALSILDHFLEKFSDRINKNYVEIRWWDGMLFLYDPHPLYAHHIIYPGEDKLAEALIRPKNGLDLTIRDLCNKTTIPPEFLKDLQLPKAPFKGDGMILKAYIYEMLDKPYEAKSCLSSPDITEDIKLFSNYPSFEAGANLKANILKTLSGFHEEDKIFKEYSAIINKAISEKRNLPKRKKAFELIEIANESFNRNEFEKALTKYNQAVQVDSLVLSEENVQEYLEKCASKISEMKLKERRNTPKRKKALEIIETANESFSRKDFISAHIKYNQAVQIDSLVLSDENVQEYLEKCVNEIPELKLKVRSDAYVILDKGKEFLTQKKFEESLYCFGMIVKSGVYMSTEKFIELWNGYGEAYKSTGNLSESNKAFQTAKDLEQKLKDKSEQKGKTRGR